MHIYFEEKSPIPQEFSALMLQSKGFLAEITVDDFQLRGKSVKLHIKRRRSEQPVFIQRSIAGTLKITSQNHLPV
ncbi:ISAon1 family transposase N-terminal region protein [Chryseobacterium lacus]